MTPKAEALLDEVELTNLGKAPESARMRAHRELAAYLTELERKAQLLDTHPGGHAMHHTGDCSVDTLDN